MIQEVCSFGRNMGRSIDNDSPETETVEARYILLLFSKSSAIEFVSK